MKSSNEEQKKRDQQLRRRRQSNRNSNTRTFSSRRNIDKQNTTDVISLQDNAVSTAQNNSPVPTTSHSEFKELFRISMEPSHIKKEQTIFRFSPIEENSSPTSNSIGQFVVVSENTNNVNSNIQQEAVHQTSDDLIRNCWLKRVINMGTATENDSDESNFGAAHEETIIPNVSETALQNDRHSLMVVVVPYPVSNEQRSIAIGRDTARNRSRSRRRRNRNRQISFDDIFVDAPLDNLLLELDDVEYEPISDNDVAKSRKKLDYRVFPRYSLTNAETSQQEAELYKAFQISQNNHEEIVPATESSTTCCVCRENTATRIVIPCGHFCLCYSCAANIALNRTLIDGYRVPKLCPLCQAAISHMPRVC